MDDKDKLVTLAIHSIETAQELQAILTDNDIESVLQNVNDDPTLIGNVRVRIKGNDLQRAIKIVEELNAQKIVKEALKDAENIKNEILVPIDYSDYSWRACQFAFRLARNYKTSVVLLHSYIDTTAQHSILGEIIGTEKKNEPTLQDIKNKAKEEERKFDERIKQEIANKNLPAVNYHFITRQGIPEEEILDYSDHNQPSIVIMGTRGRNQKDAELIGSVTAEIIERSKIPVFTIPENTSLTCFDDIHDIAYATRFDDKDLRAFGKLMILLKPFKFKVHFIHFAKEKDDDNLWSEIKLSGIRDYFEKTYPGLEIEYDLLKGDDILTSLDKFVHETQIDVVSLTTHRRSLFVRLFNPSIAKRMVFHSDTAMLVFHA